MAGLRAATRPLRPQIVQQSAATSTSSFVHRRHFSQSRLSRQQSSTPDLVEQAVEGASSSSSAYSSFLSSASDAFLTLPEHLPLHPSYATSIVLLTLALRCSITLPMTVWQRKRVKRVQTEVIPRVKEYMEKAKFELRAEFRKAGKDYDEYAKELNKRTKEQFKKLSSKYRCVALPTILVPPAVHLPVFISVTLTLREACNKAYATLASGDPLSISQLAGESLAWCNSLADMDPTAMLPVLVGLTAFSNVEIQQAARAKVAEASQVSLDEPASLPKQAASRPASRPPVTRPPSVAPKLGRRSASTAAAPATASPQPLSDSQIRAKALTNVLRGASVMFVPIAAFTPVAVNLYWLTSNLFSIAQNLVIGYREKKGQ